MDSKVCTQCKKLLPFCDFNKNNTKKDGLQSHCRFCNRIKSKKHYEENKEYHYKAANKRKQEVVKKLRQFIYDYIRKNGCVDCGENTPECCDFDHVTGDKKGNISQMVHRGLCMDTILNEINKCVIRCSNCHRKKTAKDFKWYIDLEK